MYITCLYQMSEMWLSIISKDERIVGVCFYSNAISIKRSPFNIVNMCHFEEHIAKIVQRPAFAGQIVSFPIYPIHKREYTLDINASLFSDVSYSRRKKEIFFFNCLLSTTFHCYNWLLINCNCRCQENYTFQLPHVWHGRQFYYPGRWHEDAGFFYCLATMMRNVYSYLSVSKMRVTKNLIHVCSFTWFPCPAEITCDMDILV